MKNVFYVRLALENALYEHTTDKTTLEEMEEIRTTVNKVIDDFIKENNIKRKEMN